MIIRVEFPEVFSLTFLPVHTEGIITLDSDQSNWNSSINLSPRVNRGPETSLEQLAYVEPTSNIFVLIKIQLKWSLKVFFFRGISIKQNKHFERNYVGKEGSSQICQGPGVLIDLSNVNSSFFFKLVIGEAPFQTSHLPLLQTMKT